MNDRARGQYWSKRSRLRAAKAPGRWSYSSPGTLQTFGASKGGGAGKARDLLAPVYGWFTEGFDTPDLKEVKALLEALNA
jgi:hypothetical protein